MEKLTKPQQEALSKFPDTGWYRVDNVPCFWVFLRRNEYTASILAKKGYLEERLITPPNTSFRAWYYVYRKIDQTKSGN